MNSPGLLEALQAERPDVLVLDSNVPDISGMEVLRFVRHSYDELTLPVLMLTAAERDGIDLLQALDAGANDFATKPFDRAELRARISTLLRIRRLHHRALRAERQVAEALTREERARAEVEAQRKSLHELFMQAPVGICLLQGKDHVFEFANAAYCDIVGRTDLPGMRIRDAMPELEGQGLLELLDTVFSTGERFDGRETSVRLRRHDSDAEQEAYFDFVYQPMRASPGVVDGIMVLVTEVTARVRARLDDEQLLREREDLAERIAAERNLLTAVLDHTPVGILVVDPHGAALLTNHRTQIELKHPPPTTAGPADYPKWPILKDDGSPLEIENYPASRALRGEEAVGYEVGYQFGDGSLGTLQVSSGPVRGNDGEVQAGVVVFQDVTARKTSLVQEQKRAEFEKQLIGIVSHDLRTPIGAISLGADLLARDQTLTERQARLVERIVSSSGRASRMITDLLDFTAVRLGDGLPVRFAPVELHELTRRVLGEVLLSIGQKRQVDLVQTGDAHGEWDADRLAQLLINLVTNALHYSPRASIVVVETRADREHAYLTVRNQGPPIPPELRQRLFMPMQRGIDELEASRRSVGLGLFIVDEIVRAHRGAITVSSTERDGTSFSVQLPKRLPT